MATDHELPGLLHGAAARVRVIGVPLADNLANTTMARMSLLFQWSGVANDRDGDQIETLGRKFRAADTALDRLASQLDASALQAAERIVIEEAEALAAALKAAAAKAAAAKAAADAAAAKKH